MVYKTRSQEAAALAAVEADRSSDPPTASPGSLHAGNSTLYNLYLLGRIPFCFEGPLWCLLGTTLHHVQRGRTSLATTVLSTGLVFFTNVSINYANEYFDFEADSILAGRADERVSHGGSKMLVDGTFPRRVALLCAGAVQAFVLVCILLSRAVQGAESSLQGTVLWFGLAAMFAAQQYVGPPLRLHYNGGGEVVSSAEIAPGPVLYGFLSQVTAFAGRGLDVTEAWRTLTPATRLFLAWCFVFELGRIFMMHAADITEDRIARKHTLASTVGYRGTRTLYLVTALVAGFLAWNLVLLQPRAAWLMVPAATYSLPINHHVLRALAKLCGDGGDDVSDTDVDARGEASEEGKKAFGGVPVLVSLQTMLTPVLFTVIVLLVGDCLA